MVAREADAVVSTRPGRGTSAAAQEPAVDQSRRYRADGRPQRSGGTVRAEVPDAGGQCLGHHTALDVIVTEKVADLVRQGQEQVHPAGSRPAPPTGDPAPAGGVVIQRDGRARRFAEPVAAEVGDDKVDVAEVRGVGAAGPPVG